jgi:uncharacterized protein YkwD
VKGRLSAVLVLVLVGLACAGFAASASAATGLQDARAVGPKRVHEASRAARASAPSAPSAAGQLIAPSTACPGWEDLAAAAVSQEQAMECMVNFARREAGLGELSDAADLGRSAADKALDILRCDSFSHFACGREFTYWMQESGYISTPCWHVGENLAWGTGEYGSVRSIFQAWMRSPDHRANILGQYDETGVSLRVGALEGQPDTHVWTEHFGSHCDD